jgi:hypothetical protein
VDSGKRLLDMLGALVRLRELSARERWTRAAVRADQRKRFAAIVRHAAQNTAFHVRHYAGIDLDGDIRPAALPTVDKPLLMANVDDAVADRRLTLDGVRRHLARMTGDGDLLGRYRAVGTAGTSGLRGFFVYDRPAWRVVLANTLRWQRMMDVDPRLPARARIASIGAEDPIPVTGRIARSVDVGLFRVRHFEATQPFRSLVEGPPGVPTGRHPRRPLARSTPRRRGDRGTARDRAGRRLDPLRGADAGDALPDRPGLGRRAVRPLRPHRGAARCRRVQRGSRRARLAGRSGSSRPTRAPRTSR